MRDISTEALAEILSNHALWLTDSNQGERADLSSADLRGANLTDACLTDACLTDALLPEGFTLPKSPETEAA